MNIPKFSSIAGQSYPIGSMGYGDQQVCTIHTTLEDFLSYSDTLEKKGYKLYSKSSLSAGSFNPYPENLFYTFCGEKENVFLSFNPSMHLTRIVETPKTSLPEIDNKEKNFDSVTAASITQYPVKIGMCYIVQLTNGNFIMIDGGSFDDDDVSGIYSFLMKKSADKTPIIENWIFTHPDVDHIELATHFLNRYLGKIKVLAFTYQFCDPDLITNKKIVDQVKTDTQALNDAIAKYENAVVFTPHMGQTYYYSGLNVVFLWTCEDSYPAIFNNFNEVSLALKINFQNGKSALILGDCMHETCRRIAHTYGEYLKCDYLQVTHHGLIGGDKMLYHFADPDVCFWPTPEERFLGKLKNQKYQWCIGEGGCDYNAFLRDNKIKKRIHYPNKDIITITND